MVFQIGVANVFPYGAAMVFQIGVTKVFQIGVAKKVVLQMCEYGVCKGVSDWYINL